MNDYLFHISDLHLGSSIDDVGDHSKTTMRNIINYKLDFDPIVDKIRFQSHSNKAILALDKSIDVIKNDLNIAEKDIIGYSFTGDIAANKYTKDIINSFHYKYVSSKIDHAGSRLGLGVDPNKIVPTIGNHDKMGLTKPDNYISSEFGAKNKHSLNIKTGKADFVCKAISNNFNRLYAFICIDSNLYKANTMASGEISDLQFEWLTSQIEEIKSLSNKYDSIVIILKMHHSPINISFSDVVHYHLSLKIRGDGANRLLNDIAAHVNLILFGHLHRGYIKKYGNTHLIAAGTALEFNTDNNFEYSFNVISFDEQSFTCYQCVYDHDEFCYVPKNSDNGFGHPILLNGVTDMTKQGRLPT